jgi:hypothetical protein
MLHLLLLIASSFTLLISATSLPPFTLSDTRENNEFGTDIAQALVNFFASNNVFTSDNGPDLVDQLVKAPFQMGSYQFQLEDIKRGGTLDGGFTATEHVLLNVNGNGRVCKAKINMKFEHQESLETPDYNDLQDYENCKKLYRPTKIKVSLY